MIETRYIELIEVTFIFLKLTAAQELVFNKTVRFKPGSLNVISQSSAFRLG